MTHSTLQTRTFTPATVRDDAWLTRYYGIRAAFSVAWVAVAFALGRPLTPLGGVLLVVYPAWDALANLYDARRHGGLKANATQAFNVVVSSLVAVAVLVALTSHLLAVLTAFGLWAALSGLLQLATGVRRWRAFSGQWPMILSGAQSTLAGAHFLHTAAGGVVPSSVDVAPYAAFGALYFAISAIALARATRRQAAADAAA